GAAIVAYLPERASGEANFQHLGDPADACAPLNLNGVAARNVDAALTKVEIVASERGDEHLPGFVREDRTTGRELVRDLTAAEPLATRERRLSARQVKRVRADRIELLSPPSETHRLHIEVRQAEPVKAGFRPIMDIQTQVCHRRSGGQRQ